MSSLADEILKLHQLHVAGVLTAEEFAEAKKGLISGGSAAKPATPVSSTSSPVEAAATPAAAVVSPPPAPVQPIATSASPIVGAAATAVVVDTSMFEVSHIGMHDTAYRHLLTILGNIAANPLEPKFRRLRRSNPKLSAELFSSAGAERLLSSVGFVDVKEGNGVENEFFVLPMPPNSTDEQQQTSLVRSALSEVQRLQQRDSSAALEAINASKLLRTVSLDIRQEQCRKMKRMNATSSASAAAATPLAPPTNPFLSRMASVFETFLGSLFLLDDINDGLALDNVRRLITVEENALRALAFPSSSSSSSSSTSSGITSADAAAVAKQTFEANYKKFLRMPLANVAASKLIFGQKGAVETLVELGGWTLRGTPHGSSAVSALWSPLGDITDTSSSSTSAPPLSFTSAVPFDIVLMGPVDQPLSFEDLVDLDVSSTGAPSSPSSIAAVHMERCNVTIAFLRLVEKMLGEQGRQLAMRDREEAMALMREEMQKSMLEERGKQRRVVEQQARAAAMMAGEGGGNGNGGVRVKTEDAIKYLLGKETRENVMAKAAEREAALKSAPPAAGKSRLLANMSQSNTAPMSAGAGRGQNGNGDDVNQGGGGAQLSSINTNLTQAIATLAAANDDFDSDWSDE